MTSTRRYVSVKRSAQAEETRQRILDAFRDQLMDPGRDALSPTEAAAAAGCSVRTVHGHFPTKESRVAALAESLEQELYPEPIPLPESPEALPDHFRRVHQSALGHPLAAALINYGGDAWKEVRATRRQDRLTAVRRVVESIGAPPDETADALAVILALAGAEVSFIMRDQYGISPARIPNAVAHTVELIVADLRQVSRVE